MGKYIDFMPQDADEVAGQLSKILSSSLFSSSSRSSTFLRFCIEQMLQGNESELKESTLGVEVFGRPPDYDPKIDAIVRVHARRVRDKLDSYYHTVGTEDELVISIPKGRYIPFIDRRAPSGIEHCLSGTEARGEPPIETTSIRDLGNTGRWPWTIAVLCLVALVAILAVWMSRRYATASLRTTAEPRLFTWFPGLEVSPSWAPNNETLAYAWDEGHPGLSHIFIQRLDQAEPRRLTTEAFPELRPVWSRDGREIAFLRSASAAKYDVIRRVFATGTELKVGSFSYYWAFSSDPPSLDWSIDGRQFLVSEQTAPDLPVRLALMDVSTGRLTPLTQPSYGTSGDFDGRFSPDGAQVAFRRGGLGDLCIVSLQGGDKDVKRITTSAMGVRGIVWSADSHSIFFANHKDSGGYSIWKTSLVDGGTEALTAFGFDAIEPTVSPDGKHLAFEHHERVVNLVEEPLAGGVRRTLSPSDQLDSAPAYSDDGRFLVFVSTRSGSEELWLQSADGTGLTQLTFLRGAGRPLNAAWAPDGSSIVIALREAGSTNLFAFTIKTKELRQITFSKDRLVSPMYSRDGRYIYFASNAEGENRIWRVETGGSGKPEQMFGDAAGFFQQSQDGRYLYFMGSGPTVSIFRRDLLSGDIRSIFKSDQHVFSLPSFVLAGSTLYIALNDMPAGNGASILAVDLNRGVSTTVLHVEQFAQGIPPNLGFSPTRKSLVIPEIQRENSDIYILPLSK